MKFPVADAFAEVLMLATRSWRKVCRLELMSDVLLVLLEVVLVVLLDALLLEADLSAETRLVKSDCSVLRLLLAGDAGVDEAGELSELAPNCEINCSSLLVKLE